MNVNTLMKARNLFLSLVAAALCALQMNAEYNSPLRPSVLLKDSPNLLDELLKPSK